MADITSKRGPRDPSEGLSNQGVATQAMLNSMAREQQYELNKRLNKKSTWDKIMGGVKDVVNIGKGVMDIANSYEDLQVIDEQIKRSELMRQKQELNLEASKQQMGIQSLQNEIKLNELKTDNEFVDTVYNYKKNNDDDGLVKYVLENSKSAAKNSPLVRYLAQQYEKDGNQNAADALYIAAAPGNKQQQINSTYGKQSEPTNSKAANPEKYRDYTNYKASVDSVLDILTNTDNIDTVVELLGRKYDDMATDLMTKCVFMEASNTANKNLDTKAYNTTVSVDPDTNLSTQQPATGGKNIQYLDITCPASDNPDDVVTGRIVYDADKEVTRPVFTTSGVYKGTETVPAGKAISDIIAQNKEYLKSIGKANKYAPAITTEKVLEEQDKIIRDKILSESASPTPTVSDVPTTTSTPIATPEKDYSDKKIVSSGGKTKIVNKSKTELKKQDKQNKEALNNLINTQAKFILDNRTPRSNMLKNLDISEKKYDKLGGAIKSNLIQAIVRKKHEKTAGLSEDEKKNPETQKKIDNEIKEEIKLEFDL